MGSPATQFDPDAFMSTQPKPAVAFDPDVFMAGQSSHQKSAIDDIGDTLKQYWQKINPVTQAQGVASLVTTDPRKTVSSYGDTNSKLYDAAKDAFKKGDYAQGVRHSLSYFLNGIPGLGSALDEAGNKAGSGDYKEAIADTAALATNLAAAHAAPAIVGAATEPGALARATAPVRAAFHADPSVAMVKALKPTPSDSGFVDRLPNTLANIKAANPGVSGVEDLIPATQKAINNHQAAFESWMDPARQRGTQVSGTPIADATRSAIPDSMILEDPEAAQRIVDQAHTAYGTNAFSVDQLRQLLKEKNAELDSFYDKATGKQQASVTSGSPQAVVKAQRDAIADNLYKALDPENAGAGPRQIQQETGDMIDILDSANKRRNATIAEKPVTKAGAAGKAVVSLADLPGKALTGELEQGLSNVHAAFGGTTDPLIRRAFDSIGEPQPVPTPNTTPYNPRAGQMGNPQLGSGPVITPPPADTSGIVPGAEPRPGAGLSQQVGERQLPPATGPIKQSGTAVQDMIPIRNSDTGEVTYHSEADLRDLRNLGGTPGTVFEKPTGVKFTVKAVDPAKNTTTYDMETVAGKKASRTQPTSVFQKLVADAKTTPPPQPATPPAGSAASATPVAPPAEAAASLVNSNTGVSPEPPVSAPTENRPQAIETTPADNPQPISSHKVGDTVNLRGVGKVTIKAINPDGSFDY